jgi:hypothetical protein
MKRMLAGSLLIAMIALGACASPPTTGGGGGGGAPSVPTTGGSGSGGAGDMPSVPTTGGSGSGGAGNMPSVPTTGGSGSGGAGDMPSVPTTGWPTPSTGKGDMGNDDEVGGSDVDDAATTAGAVGSADTAEASTEVSADGGISEEPAMTADERKRALARKLDESLNDFDSTLEDEQRRTAAERDARTASAASTRGDEIGDEGRGSSGRSGDLRSERDRRQSTVAGGVRGAGGAVGGARDRGAVGAGSGAPDRGIPSGDDDDIVARRLRRAAEQETDPELKEKLWQEYIEYKRNAQG